MNNLEKCFLHAFQSLSAVDHTFGFLDLHTISQLHKDVSIQSRQLKKDLPTHEIHRSFDGTAPGYGKTFEVPHQT